MIHTDKDPAADLANRIMAIARARREDGTSPSGPTILQALAIAAARQVGQTANQADAEARHIQARALGTAFSSIVELIWQTEAQMEPENGSKRY